MNAKIREFTALSLLALTSTTITANAGVVDSQATSDFRCLVVAIQMSASQNKSTRAFWDLIESDGIPKRERV
jgi:hypothetical protein